MKIFPSLFRISGALLVCCLAVSAAAQNDYTGAPTPEAQRVAATLSNVYGAPPDYIERFIREAQALEQTLGIPAVATVGIATLESAGFTSELFMQSQNPFGIKASAPWQGPTYGAWHDQQFTQFRAYGSTEEAVQDFGRFVYTRRWFADAFTCASGDYNCFLNGLQRTASEPGYSIDPAWANKVRDLIQRYDIGVLGSGATAGQ